MAGSVSPLDPPPGTGAKLIPAAGGMVGSVGNLHRSVETLDAGHFCHRRAMDALLVPAVLRLSAAPGPAPAARRLYRCKGCSCSPRCYDCATSARGTPCPVCKGDMTTEVQLVEPAGDHGGGSTLAAASPAGEGSGSSSKGYVRDMVTYTVMDDLSVAPMSTICAVTALVALGVTDIAGLQSKTVEIGYKEGLALLKASLQSQTVLTDVFLREKESSGSTAAGLGSPSPYRSEEDPLTYFC